MKLAKNAGFDGIQL